MRILVSCALFVSFFVGSLPAQTTPDTRAAAESVVLSLPAAWNARDAEKFAAAFTEGHDYVAVGGFLRTGMSREQNAKAHASLWKTRYAGGSTIAFEIKSIDVLAPNVVAVLATNHNEYVENGQSKTLDSVATMVLVSTAEGWRIRQFNNNLVMVRPESPPKNVE